MPWNVRKKPKVIGVWYLKDGSRIEFVGTDDKLRGIEARCWWVEEESED